jgi:hypothetical protein
MPEDLLASIDNWRAVERPVPTRSEAMRRLIERGLAQEVMLAAAIHAAVNQLIAEGLLPHEVDRSVARRLTHLTKRRLDPAALDALQRRSRRRL